MDVPGSGQLHEKVQVLEKIASDYEQHQRDLVSALSTIRATYSGNAASQMEGAFKPLIDALGQGQTIAKESASTLSTQAGHFGAAQAAIKDHVYVPDPPWYEPIDPFNTAHDDALEQNSDIDKANQAAYKQYAEATSKNYGSAPTFPSARSALVMFRCLAAAGCMPAEGRAARGLRWVVAEPRVPAAGTAATRVARSLAAPLTRAAAGTAAVRPSSARRPAAAAAVRGRRVMRRRRCRWLAGRCPGPVTPTVVRRSALAAVPSVVVSVQVRHLLAVVLDRAAWEATGRAAAESVAAPDMGLVARVVSPVAAPVLTAFVAEGSCPAWVPPRKASQPGRVASRRAGRVRPVDPAWVPWAVPVVAGKRTASTGRRRIWWTRCTPTRSWVICRGPRRR
ncbi:hypothetical protein [Gandjariella thermophila]|uniref:hypothetical protein n=1 Tax=Gandjariella thermophila TaxID=1931992 RepID=UPI0010FA617C|nr:hypothetical protein [Gandjariella thermophila]